VREALRGLGITVRSSLHTGEVERQGRELSGVVVHIGARVREHAQPGDMLVSSVVRDLVSGTSLSFADNGPTRLKGIPGEWRLYSVTA
jgi:class 3 adenylate cyclase